MDISSVNSDLIRGNVTTIILGCLLNDDKYGYEILKEIEDKSNSQYVLKQATLYNQLKRLEKQGLVSSYDGDPDDTGGAKRRYYTLTPEGKALLTKERSEYEYSRTILDKLVSEKEFDFTVPIPFDASELRPYSKRDPSESKVVYKDKIVEKLVEVEKKIYFDRYGNPVSEDEARLLREQAELDDEKARKNDEELRLANERLKESEDQIRQSEERLRKSEEDAKQNEERLRQTEEQLRKSEEDRDLVKTLLRQMEEEKLREEETRKKQEEEERLRLEEEEARKREEQQKPSQTLEEMFAKLDAESEYKNSPVKQNEFEKVEPTEHTYINGYTNMPEQMYRSQTTLKDIFKKLDEKEAQIDDRIAKEQEIECAQQKSDAVAQDNYVQSELQSNNENNNRDGQFATSAVINRANDGFEYEKDDVNYRDFFYSIAADNQETQQQIETTAKTEYADSDIKTRLYAKGFKIRPYDRGNTSEYYTFNFLQSNRINRDTFLIILAFFAVEIAIMWASLATRISYSYFLPILLVGSALCIVPTVIYLLNPTKRKRANFNFKLSLLNRAMIFIELSVVCVLIGFFALGASINDIDLILCSIILPIVLLTNIPLSSLIYWLLYRTRKYHIA